MRTLVALEFPQGPISKVNEVKLNRDWESLNRIANNEYRDRFPRKFAGSTVFDWDLEALKLATSNEGLDTINNEYKKRLEEYFSFKHLVAREVIRSDNRICHFRNIVSLLMQRLCTYIQILDKI